MSTAATPSATLVLLYLPEKGVRGEFSIERSRAGCHLLLHVVVHVLEVLVDGGVRVAVGDGAEFERRLMRVRMHQATIVESAELVELLSAGQARGSVDRRATDREKEGKRDRKSFTHLVIMNAARLAV